MVLALDPFFATEAAKEAYEPVMLVDIPELDGVIKCGAPEAVCGQFTCGQRRGFPTRFATRQTKVSGNVLCGSPFAICGQIKCGGNIDRDYEPRVRLLSDGGVGRTAISFDGDGRASVSNSSVDLVDADQVIRGAVKAGLVQQSTCRILLGFVGGGINHWLQVFQGVVDQTPTDDIIVRFEILDGSFTRHTDIPETIGGGIFDGAPQDNQGDAIPIVLGMQQGAEGILVETAGSSVLVTAMGAADVSAFVQPRDQATFPTRGEILIDSESMKYGFRLNTTLAGESVIQLGNLTRLSPVTHAAGAAVTTINEVYGYLGAHRANGIPMARRVSGGVTLPALAGRPQLNTNKGALQPVSLAEYSALQDGNLLLDIDGGNTGSQLIDGGLNPSVVSAAWVVSGTMTLETHGATLSPSFSALRIQGTGGTSFAQQDFTLQVDSEYLFGAYLDGEAGAVVSIRVGTVAAPSLYFSLADAEITPGEWVPVSVRFTATETDARIVIQVDGSADGLFAGIRVRPFEQERAAETMSYLAQRYIPRLALSGLGLTQLTARRGTWRVGGVVDQRENSKTILERLARQMGGRYFEDFRGRGKIGIPDIVGSSGSIFTFDLDSTKLESWSFDLFASDDIYTDFDIYFDRRAGSGTGVSAYRGHVYVNPTGTNVTPSFVGACRGAQGIIGGNRRPFTLLCDLIPDQLTAELVLAHYVRAHTFKGYEVELTAFLNAIQLEPTDIVEVDLPVLPDALEGETFEVWDKSFDPRRMEVSFVLRQTPVDPEPGPGEGRTLLAADDMEPAVWTRTVLASDEFAPAVWVRTLLATDELDSDT